MTLLELGTSHERTIGSKGKGLWGMKGKQLPGVMQRVYNDMVEGGRPVGSLTYRLAIGVVQNWARGDDGKGNKVSADTQGKAAAAVAEWNALRAEAHARSAKKKAKAVAELDADALLAVAELSARGVLQETWSEAARKAALEARKRKGPRVGMGFGGDSAMPASQATHQDHVDFNHHILYRDENGVQQTGHVIGADKTYLSVKTAGKQRTIARGQATHVFQGDGSGYRKLSTSSSSLDIGRGYPEPPDRSIPHLDAYHAFSHPGPSSGTAKRPVREAWSEAARKAALEARKRGNHRSPFQVEKGTGSEHHVRGSVGKSLPMSQAAAHTRATEMTRAHVAELNAAAPAGTVFGHTRDMHGTHMVTTGAKVKSYDPKVGPGAAEKAANARIMFGPEGAARASEVKQIKRKQAAFAKAAR